MNETCADDNNIISHSLAGALCVLATKQEGVFEYFKNLDGFRIEEDGTIKAIQFAGDRWVSFVLCGYKLTAMRSIRDHAHLMTSYALEFAFSSNGKELKGVRLTEETPEEAVLETHYTIGEYSPKMLRKKTHYNAGVKTLQDMLYIYGVEVQHLKSCGVSIPNFLEDISVIEKH